MHRTRHPDTGQEARDARAYAAEAVSERLAQLTRDAALLEADALHWADTGNTRFAMGCAAEAAALRAEAKRLAEVKFGQRPKARTVTFHRDPERVSGAGKRLRQHAEVLATRNGYTRFVEAFSNAAGRVYDDLLKIGRRRADRRESGLLTNRGRRIS
jgi:hypothetical protein